MKPMPLFRRLIGSICDKILILVLYILGFLIVEGIWGITDRGATYLSLGCHSPSEYSYVTLNSLYIIDKGYQLRYSQETEEEIIQNYEKADVEGIVRNFDLTITFSFILLNILYYLLSEIVLSASFGKALLGGKLVDSFCDKISSRDAFKRAIIGGILMSLAVGLRFLLDLNYVITIVLFFLIIDIPIFIKRRSLIDILSKVNYADSLSNTQKVKETNEKLLVENVEELSPIIIEEKQDIANNKLTDTKEQRQLHFPQIPQIIFFNIKDFAKLKMASLYIYIIWVAINIIALAYAMANPHMSYHYDNFDNRSEEIDTKDFYPFESYDVGSYDFSEFIVYTLAVPLCIFAIIKLILLFAPHKSLNN